MVDVEAGVHPAVLRQAHRDVAVEVDDRYRESLAKRDRDSAQVAHRNRENHDRVDVALALQHAFEMTSPAGSHVALDQLARCTLGERLFRALLRPAHMGVAADARRQPLCAGEELALAIARVGLGSPPGCGDRTPTVWRQDQIDTGLVHALPDLPPRGRAAVAEVQIDGRDDAEKLRGAHDF